VNYKAPSNESSIINQTKTIKVNKQRTSSANQKLSIDPESKGYQHTMQPNLNYKLREAPTSKGKSPE
jgi:hypothetical protein